MALNNVFNILFYITLLIAKFYEIKSNDIFKIPIGVINTNEGKNENIIESIFNNLAYVNLTIGTPPQTIPFQLDVNSQTFYVSNTYFNPNTSLTYKQLSNKEISYLYEDALSGYNAKDILKINNKEKEINFIYETKTKKDNNLSTIGLLIPNKLEVDIYPFFSSLKRAELINSYTWTIKYFTNISILDTIYNYEKQQKIIGEFIIGDEPHIYENNKNIYNESEYIKTNAIFFGSRLYWDSYFKTIYLKLKDNKEISQENEDLKIIISGHYFVEIKPDIGFFVVPNNFYNAVKDNFFNKFNQLCKEIFLTDTLFRYIECEKNETFDISSFPDIFFEHIDLETIFNLTYEDFFIFDENRNKYIFLGFNNRFTDNYIFGSIFLRKYQFTFNVDSKTIGFYKSMSVYQNNKEEDKNNDNQNEEVEEENKEKEEEENKGKEEENKEKEEEDNEKKNENPDKNNKTINNNTNRDREGTIKKYDNSNNYIFFIVIGILFLIVSLFSIFFGMYIQKNCGKRKKRINELEDENNDFNDEVQKDRFFDNNDYKGKDESEMNNYKIN